MLCASRRENNWTLLASFKRRYMSNCTLSLFGGRQRFPSWRWSLGQNGCSSKQFPCAGNLIHTFIFGQWPIEKSVVVLWNDAFCILPAVCYNWYTELRKVLNFILVDEVINMSRIKHSTIVSNARQGNKSWPPLVNELPACTCRLEACFAMKCTRSASNCCNVNVSVSFFSYFCLDQGDVFDKVTTTIAVQDENNNRPVFIQNIFIGGEGGYCSISSI